MSRIVKLREIASARAGDKGNTANIAVWAYDERHYPSIKRSLTEDRIRQAYPRLFRGRIRRFALDHLAGLNFVLDDALEGGVNTSLNLDAHGKSFSFLLLDLDVEIEDARPGDADGAADALRAPDGECNDLARG
ncbi:AtuA-related protein [Bosea vaviloviae]|uniref:Beta-lactamase n=1 Tax=Bosea vaviloviae TaxID=1526658 RepID=A0A0N1N4A3_9HYPH|nr:beta-lactamase [Bosea vaviloviae]